MQRFGPARASSRTVSALRGRERDQSLACAALAVPLPIFRARVPYAAFSDAVCFLTHLMCAPESRGLRSLAYGALAVQVNQESASYRLSRKQ